MLDADGIEANYTIVSAGPSPGKFYEDFPYHYSNHVILVIPIASDTVWLEGTSQTKPFGYMGTFTDDRDVVMITEEGAHITRIPSYDHSRNTQFRRAVVNVGAEGSATADITTVYRGIQYESGDLNFYLHLGYDKQEKWVHENIMIQIRLFIIFPPICGTSISPNRPNWNQNTDIIKPAINLNRVN